MFRKLKEEGCSGIIWAMAVAGFLLILVGAVLSISLAYQNRSRRNDDARQAYLTARSAADMVAQEFISGSPTAAEIFAYLTWAAARCTRCWSLTTATRRGGRSR